MTYIQNRIPRILKLLGYLYILSPLLYYAYYSYNYFRQTAQTNFYNIISVFSYFGNTYFAILFVIILVITPIVGIGLIIRRKWGLYLFLAYDLALLLANVLNIIVYPSRFSFPFMIVNILLIGVMLLFVRTELRAPFYKPNWEIRNKRYKHKLPVRYIIDGTTYNSFTEDISENGCFILSNEDISEGSRFDIELGEASKSLQISGEVVWTGFTNKNLNGFGFLFSPLEKNKVILFKSIINEK